MNIAPQDRHPSITSFAAGASPPAALGVLPAPAIKPVADVLLATLRLPNELAIRCFSNVDSSTLAEVAYGLHHASSVSLAPPPLLRARTLVLDAANERVRCPQQMGLAKAETMALFDQRMPHRGDKRGCAALMQQTVYASEAMQAHEEYVAGDPSYRYWIGKNNIIPLANTIMVLACSQLRDASDYEALSPIHRTGSEAVALFCNGVPWARPAAKRALLFFSLLPSEHRTSAMGHMIRGVALAFSNQPKQALASLHDARRVFNARMRAPFAPGRMPEYVGLAIRSKSPFLPRQNNPVAHHLKFELLKTAVCVSGSAQLFRFFDEWHREIRLQYHAHFYHLHQDDVTALLLRGSTHAVRVYLHLHGADALGVHYPKRIVQSAAAWGAEAVPPARQAKRWHGHLATIRALFEPLTERSPADLGNLSAPLRRALAVRET